MDFLIPGLDECSVFVVLSLIGFLIVMQEARVPFALQCTKGLTLDIQYGGHN